jgi:hypothetical protein
MIIEFGLINMIFQGVKIFYIIPPTPSNMAFYQTWQKSEKSKETFFGDQVTLAKQYTLCR